MRGADMRGADIRGADMRGAEGAARGAGPACLPLLFCACASECAADSKMRIDATRGPDLNMTPIPLRRPQAITYDWAVRLHEHPAIRAFSRRLHSMVAVFVCDKSARQNVKTK